MFFPSGFEHSLTSRTVSAWARSPWRSARQGRVVTTDELGERRGYSEGEQLIRNPRIADARFRLLVLSPNFAALFPTGFTTLRRSEKRLAARRPRGARTTRPRTIVRRSQPTRSGAHVRRGLAHARTRPSAAEVASAGGVRRCTRSASVPPPQHPANDDHIEAG